MLDNDLGKGYGDDMNLAHLDSETDHDMDWGTFYDHCDYCPDTSHHIPTLDGPICEVCENPVKG